MQSLNRNLLCRWVGWFFFANILISILVQLTYLAVSPIFSDVYGAHVGNVILGYFFLGVSFVAHATLLNAFIAIISLIIAALIPRKSVVLSVGVFLAAFLTAVTMIDRLTFNLYHSHQIVMGIGILLSGVVGEEMPLSNVEYAFMGGLILAILVIEILLARYLFKRLSTSVVRQSKKSCGRYVAIILVACVLVSYSMMVFVVRVPTKYRFNQVNTHLMLKAARVVPYYQLLYDALIPGSKYDARVLQTAQGPVLLPTRQVNRPLNYPLHPMQCAAPKKKPNILFLVFDTLRYDAVTPKIMPNVTRFAKNTVQFDDVFSGGNCTQPGVFSLFYGIPANYWLPTLKQQKGPVMLRELQDNGYQMKMFASASLLFPKFAKNVFVDVKHLRINTPGDTSVARDKKITQAFNSFVQTRNPNKPFFSFLFYDAVHNYCQGSAHAHMNPFHPAIAECARFSLTSHTDPTPYRNRYHNAAYFLDQQAGKVLAMLKQKHLLDNTIVVITADHGEQQNDQHMNYWSHASAYTPYQLHIPMMVYWPGMKPQHRNYFATNFDVVPTIMQKVLSCKNPTVDYTVGHSLFSNVKRPLLVEGSYTDYAFLKPHQQIIRVYPGGDYVVNGPLGHHLDHTSADMNMVRQGDVLLNRYFSASNQSGRHAAHHS